MTPDPLRVPMKGASLTLTLTREYRLRQIVGMAFVRIGFKILGAKVTLSPPPAAPTTP